MEGNSAIEQAKRTFDRLVKLKINQSPVPSLKRNKTAVAVLPDGDLLLSNGETKVPTSKKKILKAKGTTENTLRLPGQKGKAEKITEDLLTNIAVPEEQLTPGENKVFAFARYLNQALQPKEAGAPQVTPMPTLLPTSEERIQAETPSAIANLPPLVKETENIFEETSQKFQDATERAQKFKEELANQFASQYNRGERPAYENISSVGRTPLVTRFDASAYRLPTEQNAEYAQIARRRNPLVRRVQ